MDTHTHRSGKEIPKAPYVYRLSLSQVKGLSSFSFNCYKLSHLTSLPSTAGLQQEVAVSHTMTTNMIHNGDNPISDNLKER